MTLSFNIKDIADAIRKDGYKQITGHYVIYANVSNNEIIGACALGQAALNLQVEPASLQMYIDKLTKDSIPTCPEGHDGAIVYYSLGSMIVHLNDIHEWTLDKIADWVDSIDA